MRVIKFRVWDIENKCMSSVYGLIFAHGGICWNGPGGGHGWCELNPKFKWNRGQKPKQVDILMQYIEHDGKDGVELYEDDIVTCPGHPDNLTGRIYYNEVAGGFSIIQDGVCHYPDHFWKWSDLKVIGNIHQNPELLNQE